MQELQMIPLYCRRVDCKDSEQSTKQVPLLGDLQSLATYSARKRKRDSGEVIIVITPSVLPEDTAVHAGMPKDEDAFDRFGHRLFRDAYRIRSEDTFDLRYLTENQSLQKLQKWLTGLCKIMQTTRRYIHIINFLLDQSQERMHLCVARFTKFSNARVLLMFLTRKN